jgi:hypothetical protein
MATVPLSGTNIRLLTGVPFSNDYKNTRWFDTKEAQTNYFLSKSTTYTNTQHTFQRIEGRNFVRVKQNIDMLWGTNYIMFQNSNYNTNWFYGFVTKLEYVQADTTDVHFEIDVFQTWKFDMNFKPSFVVREHRPLWETNGDPVVNTIDEGLFYGSEYDTISVQKITPWDDDLLFLVIVSKETLHQEPSAITPNTNGMPQPLSYYIHPFKKSQGALSLKIDGASQILDDMNTVLSGIMKADKAVNNVVSLYVTEYFGKNPISYDGTTLNLDGFAFQSVQIVDNTTTVGNTIYVKNIFEYEVLSKDIGYKYNGYTTTDESKLYMYPYTVTILDDLKGNRIELKNEYIKNENLVLDIRGSLGTENKIAYMVDSYRKGSNLTDDQKDIANYESALINNSPNDISILSDYLSAYLQGNRNTIANQRSAAVFQGTIGAMTNGTIGMAQSIFHSPVGWRGNPLGVMGAGLEVAKGVGDSIVQLQGIQAKVRDVDNTPANMVKMGGNSAFDFGNNFTGIYVIKKQITAEYKKKLEDFFNMFGYKTNEVKVPNFHTRTSWNYVQTNNCTILGNMNGEDLQELKEVFDKGITIWHTDDVGNYALENGVI